MHKRILGGKLEVSAIGLGCMSLSGAYGPALSEAEAGALLRAIDAFEGHANTRVSLQLLPHVFVRPGELRYAEWADFNLEKGRKTWAGTSSPRSACFQPAESGRRSSLLA